MDELRRELALACRMLAAAGLTTPLLGHVSVRVGAESALVRCRGPRERGLLFTQVEDIRLVDLSQTGEIDGGYSLPNEFPIHVGVLRARPDVNAVLHAHPRSALLAGLAGVSLAPVFGAYDIPAYRLAARGIPVYQHVGLVRTSASGRQLAETLGDSDVCLLRGHGIVAAACDIPSVLMLSIALDELLRVSVELASLGATPAAVEETDLPDLGPEFNVGQMWRYQLAQLERSGLAEVS